MSAAPNNPYSTSFEHEAVRMVDAGYAISRTTATPSGTVWEFEDDPAIAESGGVGRLVKRFTLPMRRDQLRAATAKVHAAEDAARATAKRADADAALAATRARVWTAVQFGHRDIRDRYARAEAAQDAAELHELADQADAYVAAVKERRDRTERYLARLV